MSRNKRVIMAEKRNAAEDIAAALSLSNVTREGASKFIHGFDEDGDEIVVTWSNGHCIELPEPEDIDEKYKKWNVSDLPLPIDNDNTLKVKKDKYKLFMDIKKELEGADSIINAGDAGREGELIQRWIIKRALGNKNVGVYRLWVQSLTPKSIRDAYDNGLLGTSQDEISVLDCLYDSGRARAIMDKYIGYNYSRLISLTQTDGVTVNYGRCKSPLVHAIVERDKEIESFVSVPFSFLSLMLEKNSVRFSASLVDDSKKRRDFLTEERGEVEKILSAISDRMAVKEVSCKEKLVTPPQPYDTLQLQKEMANKYGYEASKTLEIMEKLYDTYHILSYPRTEARHYTNEIKDELHAMLPKLSFGKYKNFVEKAKSRFIPDKYFNNAKIADHHALAPVCEGNLEEIYSKLSDEERNVYDAVLLNFISLYLPNYEYESIDVISESNGYLFRTRGKRVKSLGFKEMYVNEKEAEKDDDEENKDQELPIIKKGDILQLLSKEIKDSKTKPKSRYTTASLLDYMKVNNIGTGATRDRIISELTEKKGYNADSAVKKKGKYFVSTELGRSIDGVIPDSLKSIYYLKYLEDQIQKIADGKQDLNTFIRQMDLEFNTKLQELKENSSAILAAPKATAALLEGAACPACGKSVRIMPWGYGCTGWKKDGTGCNFSLGKKQYGKSLSDKTVQRLMSGQETKKIVGLKGKSGKAFNARLILVIDEGGKAKVVPSKFE